MPYPYHDFDLLVVGAGLTGLTIGRLAADDGLRVLVLEARDTIGGNLVESEGHGGAYHKYGPHIFHCNDERIFNFLSRFTEWRPYQHKVRFWYRGKLLPLPINYDTITAMLGEAAARAVAATGLETITYADLLNKSWPDDVRTVMSELAEVAGRYVYKPYTQRMWGEWADKLDASVTSRVKIRTNNDDRYFTDRYQAMPFRYNDLVNNMGRHGGITYETCSAPDWAEVLFCFGGKPVVWTASLDDFVDELPLLPYRSVSFNTYIGFYWPDNMAATINTPDVGPFTRYSNMNMLMGRGAEKDGGVVVMTERPMEHMAERGSGGQIIRHNDALYPIPCEETRRLYDEYTRLAEATALALGAKVWFAGRLGRYQYFDMHQAVANAMSVYQEVARYRAAKQDGGVDVTV